MIKINWKKNVFNKNNSYLPYLLKNMSDNCNSCHLLLFMQKTNMKKLKEALFNILFELTLLLGNIETNRSNNERALPCKNQVDKIRGKRIVFRKLICNLDIDYADSEFFNEISLNEYVRSFY